MSLTPYNIPVADLLAQHPNTPNPIDAAVLALIPHVRSGALWFPFRRYTNPSSKVLLEQLRAYEGKVEHTRYALYSYYPKYGLYIPPLFRGQPTFIATTGSFNSEDFISDYYNEHVRLKSRKNFQVLSPLECWMNDACLTKILTNVLTKYPTISPQTLRDSIFDVTYEVGIFKPTWAKTILQLVLGDDVRGKSWLDISAGWGDRLITAILLGMSYVGYDPNTELQPGHTGIIQDLGDPMLQRIVYEPFETAALGDAMYDVVFTSPPYFDLEIYSIDQAGQSITSYPTLNQWIVWFLFRALTNAWAHIKKDGYLILHLADTKDINLSEVTNLYIENYLENSSWEGIIGLQGGYNRIRPVWVWKKSPIKNRWSGRTTVLRTVYAMYPEIYIELLRYQTDIYAPKYMLRHTNATTVRNLIANMRQYIPKTWLNTAINDLMIITVLEQMSVNLCVQYFAGLVFDYPSLAKDQVNEKVRSDYPLYIERIKQIEVIRKQIDEQLSTTKSDKVLPDDLMLYSLMLAFGNDNTVVWGIAMAKTALGM